MKILIADDEALARQRLKRILEEIDPTLDVYADANNGLEALEQCIQIQPNVALLDIRMPKMDGLQAAAEIIKAKLNTHVVFTTAYDQYALEAFDNNAIDYLLKPVKKERLTQSLERIKRLNEPPASPIFSAQPLQNPRQHLCAHTHTGLKVINVSDILFFKADNKYVEASTSNDSVLLDDSLKVLAEEFGDLFFRIHRNALVNINAIKAITKTSTGQPTLLLHGTDETLSISRRHQAELNKRLRMS